MVHRHTIRQPLQTTFETIVNFSIIKDHNNFITPYIYTGKGLTELPLLPSVLLFAPLTDLLNPVPVDVLLNAVTPDPLSSNYSLAINSFIALPICRDDLSYSPLVA
jgi:hypothetical protein